jgi:non-heme chloroperoxidase
MSPKSNTANFSPLRRRVIFASAAIATIQSTTLVSGALASNNVASRPERHGVTVMNSFTSKDGTKIYFKDWGTGRPIVFSHGWPLDADAWDAQMFFLGSQGYRVIAHDRRGHGRSGQPWNGNDMNTYADDLAGLLDVLSIKDAVLVGHSTGGGEVARYIGRHGTSRLSKAVLIGAVPPTMLKTIENPDGLSIDVFDHIRSGVLNRAQFYKELAIPFYGYNRQGSTSEPGVIDSFWSQGMLGGIKGQYDCVKQFSETDFTQDLKKFDIPTLILHGDDDQIVPIADSAQLSSKIIRNATLKIYPGAPHGMCTTIADKVNMDLLAFIRS